MLQFFTLVHDHYNGANTFSPKYFVRSSVASVAKSMIILHLESHHFLTTAYG